MYVLECIGLPAPKQVGLTRVNHGVDFALGDHPWGEINTQKKSTSGTLVGWAGRAGGVLR